MSMQQHLNELLKQANAEYAKGDYSAFLKGEALMYRYLDENDSYKKYKKRMAA